MPGFLYFRSGSTKPIDADGVRSLGIGHILDGNSSVETRATNSSSPSGVAGLIFADPARQKYGQPIGYFPEKQTWERYPDQPDLHIGYWNDGKPEPADLRRDIFLRTHEIKLDDEKYWEIPIVGHLDGEQFQSDLPAYMALDKNGRRVRGKVVAKHNGLWEIVSTLAGKFFETNAENEPPTDDEVWNATLALLQSVYVIDAMEMAILEMFLMESERYESIWMVAARYDVLEQWLKDIAKKKESEQQASGLNTFDGEMD